MPSFPLDRDGYTTAHGWRPLRLRDPMQRGWDVFDLQCRLKRLGRSIEADGWFGTKTKNAVLQLQEEHGLKLVDGIAGAVTQVTFGKLVADGWPEIPQRVKGQMQKESSMLCGIYTPTYMDGSQDRGPVQENSQYHPDNLEAFDVARCLPILVAEIKKQHDKYRGWGVEDSRAWAAAQGWWNNHVFADAYARKQAVPDSFLDYIEAVTAFV